ncbi:MAG: zinc-ribbon domain-containing protein [Pseudomonadota bacterium]
MIITCEQCNASFNLNESLLKPTGSKVRCSKCNNVFLAYPLPAEEEPVKPTEVIPELEAEHEDETASDRPDLADTEEMPEETPVAAEVADEDIEDLDLDLEPAQAPISEEFIDEDIEDLDLDFEPDKEAPEPEEVADETVALEDLDLDLDFEPDKEAPEPEEVADEAIEDLQLDLETDEETMPEAEEASDEALDELELALDMDTEPESVSTEAEESDELDLSDIEAMLDLDTAPEAESEVESEEVELEFDMGTEPEIKTDAEDVTGTELEEAGMADLSELEQLLDVEETPEVEDDATLEDFGIDLEMEEDAAASDTTGDAAEAEVMEFDEIAEPSEEEDFELEYEDETADELEVPAGKDADDFYVDTQVMEPGALLAAAGVADKEEEKEKRPVPVRKKRISRPVLIGLVVVLLAGAAFGTLALLNSRNIRIPFISDVLFKPKVEDPGNLMITPLGVNGKFVENAQAGHLFIISGRVKNDYSHNRRFLRITGKLFTKSKVAVKTETVFCGNFLSDIELANLDLGAIKTRLMNRAGDKQSNFSVKPGQMIPFMIVFSNLPDNIEEFSIEVAGSTQG